MTTTTNLFANNRKLPPRDAHGRFVTLKPVEASVFPETPMIETVNSENNFRSISELDYLFGVILELKNTCVPEIRDRYGYRIATSYEFKSNKLYVSNAKIDYSNNRCLLNYINPEGYNSAYVPLNFQVRVVSNDHEFKSFVVNWYLNDGFSHLVNHRLLEMEVGADPEIFVVDKNNNLIPAPMFLGSKKNPYRTNNGEHGNYTCYWDGFQCEFTTWSGSCLAWLVDSCYHGLKGVLNHARNKFPDARLSLDPVMFIPPELLNTYPDDVVEFGCMPSLNAYGIKTSIPDGRSVPFRSSGGHMHFGMKAKLDNATAINMVKGLDAILGVASVSLFAGIDNPLRRDFYGLPGEYRLPKHGLEYRPLSCAWLAHPLIMNMVFDLGRKALMIGRSGFIKNLWDVTEEEVINCMRMSDVNLARDILKRPKNENLLRKIFVSCYSYDIGSINSDSTTALFNVFYNGMTSVLKDPYNIEGNWRLNKPMGNNHDTHYVVHGEHNVRYYHKIIADGKKV